MTITLLGKGGFHLCTAGKIKKHFKEQLHENEADGFRSSC